MIADSRVSWEHNQYPPQDNLRKLYTFSHAKKSAVLGFCGDLQAANTIMCFLMEHKLRSYKRPFILSEFKDDIGGWIEEIAKTKLPPEKRTKVKFMLGGIEPSRHPPILKNGQVIGYTPFIEAHIYTYSISNNGNVHYNARPQGYDVIGTGQELEQEIAKKVKDTITFGFYTPQLHWARAVVMGEAIAACIKKDEKISETVGGPFQVIRITSEGLETHYIWPPDMGDRNVEVQHSKSRTIIYNPSTKENYTLYPVWRLLPYQLKGAG
jgi:hypothetical protein